MHGRGDIGIAHARVTLHGNHGAPNALCPKTSSRNSELRDDVVGETVLGSTMHRQSRTVTVAMFTSLGRRYDSSDSAVLGQIVVNGAKTGQILGMKPRSLLNE